MTAPLSKKVMLKIKIYSRAEHSIKSFRAKVLSEFCKSTGRSYRLLKATYEFTGPLKPVTRQNNHNRLITFSKFLVETIVHTLIF